MTGLKKTDGRLVPFCFDIWQEGDLWYASYSGIVRGGEDVGDAVEEVSLAINNACEAWDDPEVFWKETL